jgi:predicted DNA-binding protein
MMPTMRRTNIHLTDEQRDWLRRHSADAGQPPAAIVRLAIDHYREAHERRIDQRGHRPLTCERRKAKR